MRKLGRVILGFDRVDSGKDIVVHLILPVQGAT
jgi:hypothetical protein